MSSTSAEVSTVRESGTNDHLLMIESIVSSFSIVELYSDMIEIDGRRKYLFACVQRL